MSDPNTPETPPPASENTPAPATPAVDIDALVNTALAKQSAEFAAQLEQATGHKDLKAFQESKLKEQGEFQKIAENKTTEAEQYKARFEQSAIQNALLSASTDALDVDVIAALLQSKATVDANGVVLIDGKPPKDAVAALLTAKPYLAAARGGQGSGTPSSTAANPSAADAYALAAKSGDVLGMLTANTGVKS